MKQLNNMPIIHIHFPNPIVKCSVCGHKRRTAKLLDRIYSANDGFIIEPCKKCNTSIYWTVDMKGNVVCEEATIIKICEWSLSPQGRLSDPHGLSVAHDRSLEKEPYCNCCGGKIKVIK